MRRGIFFAAVLVGVVAFATAATGASTSGGHSSASLDLYTAVVSSAQLGQLARDGYDVAETRQAAAGVQATSSSRRPRSRSSHRRAST